MGRKFNRKIFKSTKTKRMSIVFSWSKMPIPLLRVPLGRIPVRLVSYVVMWVDASRDTRPATGRSESHPRVFNKQLTNLQRSG